MIGALLHLDSIFQAAECLTVCVRADTRSAAKSAHAGVPLAPCAMATVGGWGEQSLVGDAIRAQGPNSVVVEARLRPGAAAGAAGGCDDVGCGWLALEQLR
jgi:hypothetical protein